MGVGNCEVFIVVVVDLDHGRVDTCPKALHLADGEELVVGHLAGSDAEVLLARSHDLITATQPAGCCCANLTRNRSSIVLCEIKHLDMEFSYRVAHEHGVKGGHLIDTHARHTNHLSEAEIAVVNFAGSTKVKNLSNVVHGSDGQPAAVLPLREVQQGDDCGPLVPVRVDCHDGLRARMVLRCELKGGLMVVLSSVPGKGSQAQTQSQESISNHLWTTSVSPPLATTPVDNALWPVLNIKLSFLQGLWL